MTGNSDDDQMAMLARLLGAGGAATRLETTHEIPDVLAELRAVLDEYGGAVDQAAQDEDLFDSWDTTTPEARAAVLFTLSWNARHKPSAKDQTPSISQTYAAELIAHAEHFADDAEPFHGPNFPALPLPGPAGTAATSLAFAIDDLPTSLETALLLLALADRQ